MANNYTEGSALIEIPMERQDEAKALLAGIEKEYEDAEDYGYFPLEATFEDAGLWLCHDESIDPDVAEDVARRFVEAFDLPPFCMEFASRCSKPRLDEFGGCGFCVVKGLPTHWVSTAGVREFALKHTPEIPA